MFLMHVFLSFHFVVISLCWLKQ